MTDQRASERRAEGLLLFVVFVWAANASLAKLGLSYLDPLSFNAIRYGIAAASVFAILRSRSEWTPIQKHDRKAIVLLGLLGSVAYQLLFIFGLSFTSAGNSAVLLSTSPLWTIFISARISKESVPMRAIVGTLVSLTGIVMIIVGSGKNLDFGGEAMFGDLLSLAAAFLWAVMMALQRPLLLRYSPYQLTAASILIGAVGLSVVAIPNAFSVHWSDLPAIALVIAVVSGFFSIGIGNLFWTYGVKWLGPRRTSRFNNLVPVIAFLISWIVFDEVILAIQVVGAGMTVLGVWLARH